MKRLFSVLSLSALAVLFVGVPMAHAKKAPKKAPYIVKANITLAAGQDLVVDVEGDLALCEEWACLLYITAPKKSAAKEATVVALLGHDGSYQLRIAAAKEESSEEKKSEGGDEAKDDEAKDEDSDEESFELITAEDGTEVKVKKLPKNRCDPIDLAEYTEWSKAAAEDGKEPADDSWKKLPVLTYEERLACKRRGQAYKTYELDEFTDGDPMASEDDEAKAPKFDKSSHSLEDADGSRRLVIPSTALPEGAFDVSTNGYWGAHVDDREVGSAGKTGVIRIDR